MAAADLTTAALAFLMSTAAYYGMSNLKKEQKKTANQAKVQCSTNILRYLMGNRDAWGCRYDNLLDDLYKRLEKDLQVQSLQMETPCNPQEIKNSGGSGNLDESNCKFSNFRGEKCQPKEEQPGSETSEDKQKQSSENTKGKEEETIGSSQENPSKFHFATEWFFPQNPLYPWDFFVRQSNHFRAPSITVNPTTVFMTLHPQNDPDYSWRRDPSQRRGVNAPVQNQMPRILKSFNKVDNKMEQNFDGKYYEIFLRKQNGANVPSVDTPRSYQWDKAVEANFNAIEDGKRGNNNGQMKEIPYHQNIPERFTWNKLTKSFDKKMFSVKPWDPFGLNMRGLRNKKFPDRFRRVNPKLNNLSVKENPQVHRLPFHRVHYPRRETGGPKTNMTAEKGKNDFRGQDQIYLKNSQKKFSIPLGNKSAETNSSASSSYRQIYQPQFLVKNTSLYP